MPGPSRSIGGQPGDLPGVRHVKRFDLVQMRWIALGLLAGAAALYMLATALEARHAAWGYVAAFSEAAMVGAIADWFAVVALFRHPLGLPIPHTAIIPSNKDRIGENLAAFICEHFLSTSQVLAKLSEFDAGARTARWLADARHAEQVAQHAGAALRYALGALDDERVRRFFRTTVLAELSRADVSTLGSQVLDVLTLDRRHHEVLDAVLRKLAVLLDNEQLQAQVAEAVAGEVKYLRFVGLDTVAGRYATAKMVAGIMRLVGEMAEDPAHPLRLQFDEVMASFVQRLKADPALRERVEAAKQDLLSSPTLATYLQGVWTSMVDWMRGDLDQPESRLRARAAEAIRLLGERLQGDLGMQAWINEQLMAAAPRWIERYREDIRGYIVARVREWNAEEMTGELERNIGRDLQFIRVNGTVVGGLVGLGIYTVTQLMR
jgi:uncharacterized membrane-anchored protein YjiN (DUF445 family)